MDVAVIYLEFSHTKLHRVAEAAVVSVRLNVSVAAC